MNSRPGVCSEWNYVPASAVEATRRAKLLPMTDLLHPWRPVSIRGPFAEVAREASHHQRGGKSHDAIARPVVHFFVRARDTHCGPLALCPCVTESKKSALH